jgi:hypothetical protein
MGPVFFFLLCVLGCQDPPDPTATPPPSDLPRYATAPHVQWAGLAPTDRILAVFVDEPGGPLDRLAHDADVATFLNDRFSPIFIPPDLASNLPKGILFVDTNGCLRLAPVKPTSPSEFIAAGNDVMLGSPPQEANFKPINWSIDIPADHPLRLRCSSAY